MPALHDRLNGDPPARVADLACGLSASSVTIFEALHEMSYPVDVLQAAHGLLTDGGRVLVADERTADRFALDAGTSNACITTSA